MAMMMMEMVAGKKGKDESFKRWIQDGTVLAKVVIMDHEMLIMGVMMIMKMVAGNMCKYE